MQELYYVRISMEYNIIFSNYKIQFLSQNKDTNLFFTCCINEEIYNFDTVVFHDDFRLERCK
jgi:hypothetical protein